MTEPMIESILINLGIEVDQDRVHVDWSPAKLIEHAVSHHEAYLTSTGSLSVSTGAFTGRSPEYRYLVDAGEADKNINWNSKQNKPIDEATYKRVRKNVARYMSQRRHLFVVRGYAGRIRRSSSARCSCARRRRSLRTSAARISPCTRRPPMSARPTATASPPPPSSST